MPMTSAAVQSALDTLVFAIRDELRAEFLAALGAGATPSPFNKGRGRPIKTSIPRSRAKGAKRTPEELEALTKSALAFIRKNPGSRVEQIGAGLGVPTKDLVLPIGKLFEAKSIKSTGVCVCRPS